MTDGFPASQSRRSGLPGALCVGCVVAGMLLVLLSLGLTLRARSWVKASIHAQGTIVAVTPASRSSDGSQTFYPVYEAVAADGHTFNMTGSVSTSPAPTIGGRAMLAYPSGKPGEAVVIGLLGIWFLPILVGVIGVIWTLVGVVILLVASHPRKVRASA